MSIKVCISGAVREVSTLRCGVSGITRDVQAGYCGVGGVVRQAFFAGPPPVGTPTNLQVTIEGGMYTEFYIRCGTEETVMYKDGNQNVPVAVGDIVTFGYISDYAIDLLVQQTSGCILKGSVWEGYHITITELNPTISLYTRPQK